MAPIEVWYVATHYYPLGTYTVSLVVTDDNGGSITFDWGFVIDGKRWRRAE